MVDVSLVVQDMLEYIDNNNVWLFSEFNQYCKFEKPEWYRVLKKRNAHIFIYEYIKGKRKKDFKQTKLDKEKQKVCSAIECMTAKLFYDFCSEIEQSGNQFNFDIFDCGKCHELFYRDHLECNHDCVACFMAYMEEYEEIDNDFKKCERKK